MTRIVVPHYRYTAPAEVRLRRLILAGAASLVMVAARADDSTNNALIGLTPDRVHTLLGQPVSTGIHYEPTAQKDKTFVEEQYGQPQAGRLIVDYAIRGDQLLVTMAYRVNEHGGPIPFGK